MKLFVSILSLFLLVKFHLNAQSLSVPYSNGFETPAQISEWNHYAISGIDDWEAGIPVNFGNANSNAWVTTLNGNCVWNAIRCIESPDFDLSNLPDNMVLMFHQQRSGSYCYYYLEYSTNQGTTWQLLDDANSPKLSWQGNDGWSGNYVGAMQRSAIQINFLQGFSSVRFRFRFVSTSNASRGWMIDDFIIQDEYINVTATSGQTNNDITTYFNQFTLTNSFIYNTPYLTTVNFRNAYYLSTDTNFDYSDTYLGNANLLANSTVQTWNKTFNLPQGLAGGDYYVIGRHDTLNSVVEDNENDNISVTLLHLIEPIPVNYSDNFDTVIDNWKKIGYANDTTWRLGDPDQWHIESAHSNPNSWYSWNQLVNNAPPDLESPFLNLTTSNDNSICFWFNYSGYSGVGSNLFLKLPDLMNSNISIPTFNNPSNEIQIPLTRRYGWDCYCHDINGWNGEVSTKFRLNAWGNISSNSPIQAAVDDIYIGQKKPDISIENDSPGRFTSSLEPSYSLEYILYNSGLQTLPSTQTNFYWSSDSILDPTDLLVSTVNEPVIADTSYLQRTLTFTKPSLAQGIYHIIWETDVTHVVDEMREYNNTGIITINQQEVQPLPYINDFENQIDGWRHISTLGHDDWQWSIATGNQITEVFSGEKAFITNGGGDTVSRHSRSHLFTPIFDLSQLTNPVLEFDLMAMFYDVQYNYTYWPFNMGNIMYSVNGGADWEVLKPQNKSFKRMYSKMEFNIISGTDDFLYGEFDALHGDALFGKNQPTFYGNWDYQSRDYDDNSHYVVDLSFLSGQKVQFMFVYANEDAPMEGMLIDNFTIREHQTDLCIPTTKKLLTASGDKKITTFFHVQNRENYISPETKLKVYCSIDSTLDASDLLVATRSIDSLKPFEKQLVVMNEDAPNNFGNYHYMLCKTDAENSVAESNELNNVHVFDLAMDSCSDFQYPLVFHFEEKYVDGWSWDHDSSGYYFGNTFRTQKVIQDPSYGTNNGEWFMDPLDPNGFGMSLSAFPTYHLYSPAFDFSGLYDIDISFDIMCITGSGSNEGGNVSYSIDGGQTWNLLFLQDPNPINWYNTASISELQGQAGWNWINDWLHCQFDVSFLAGQPNVHFRFNYKGKHRVFYPGPQGFRMDNFRITGVSTDLLTQDNLTVIEANLTNPMISVNYHLENTSNFTFDTVKTGFYWSEDNNFDATDIFMGDFQENQIAPNLSGTLSKLVTYPTPILQNTYYVFHVLDNPQSIAESNENNNTGRTEVHFSTTNIGLDEEDLIQSIKQLGNDYLLQFIPGRSIEVDFLNLLGQKICSGNVDSSNGSLVLKPGQLATGTYLLKMTSNGKSSLARIFHH